jgi:uncharacterized protein YgiM (DUF1202 family)
MKNNKTILYVGVGLAVAVVGFFAFRMIRNKKEMQDAGIVTEDIDSTIINTPPTAEQSAKKPVATGNIFADLGSTIRNIVSNYKSYRVATLTGSLNVREKPDSKSKIIGSIKKDTIIKAKPSGTAGWFEYSKDSQVVTGYISSTYLRLV